MKHLEFRNHNINLSKSGNNFVITPHYFTNSSLNEESPMGDIHLSKLELSILIVKLTELIHG